VTLLLLLLLLLLLPCDLLYLTVALAGNTKAEAATAAALASNISFATRTPHRPPAEDT
jgi:hypothetical protein